MTSSRLAIRVDADSSIGAGHLMRCLALAQEWKRTRGEVTFLAASDTPGLHSRLRAEGMSVEVLACDQGGADDSSQVIARVRELGVEWAVVDGYHFDARYQEALKEAGLRLLVIDDYAHAECYAADLVLNQNLHAAPSLYPSLGTETELLLSTRFVLLRQEFLDWEYWERPQPRSARKILVTLGGGDSSTVLVKVIDGLLRLNIDDLDVKIVCGQLNQNRDLLVRAAESATFRVELIAATDEMPGLMAWADLAISGGGSTCWELAFMGLPALVIVLADNQLGVVEELEGRGIVVGLGRADRLTVEALSSAVHRLLDDRDGRAEMSRLGRDLVDGRGASRVVAKLVVRHADLTTGG